ncbi:MAG: hypothetical protein QOI83_4391 [Streptomycetaceae bacterium]|jgi:RNA polymerase sigma-70 factor (sigma-E family)|nr:hypothetical protein [Streptomycetaceae bacterium]
MKSEPDEDFHDFMVSRWPRLLRTAYLITGNHHEAEELAQATMAVVFAKWGRVRRSDDMNAYVSRIMINKNADRFRRSKGREWITALIPDTPVPDRTAQIQERSVLVDALARLPRRQRAAVVLCYFNDMTHTQIATVLGTQTSTVRSQITRALARLRQDHTLADLTARADDFGGRGQLSSAEKGEAQ